MPLTKPTSFTWGGTQTAPTAPELAAGYAFESVPTHQAFNWLLAQLGKASKWIVDATGVDINVSPSDGRTVADAIADTIPLTQKAAPSGVATLDVAGKLAQSPPDGAIARSHLAPNVATNSNSAVLTYATTAGYTANNTGGAYVDIAGLSFSLTVTGGPILVAMHISSVGASGVIFGIAVSINGVDYEIGSYSPSATATHQYTGNVYITGLAAGTYVIQGRVKNGATMQLVSTTSMGIGYNKIMRLAATEYRR